MSRALIVVDVQATFCEGGALPVAGGDACAQRIARFIADRRSDYSLIATTQDWHIAPGTHFSSEPDFIDTWPPHGIAGTQEAELHPALAGIDPDVCVKKGQFSAAYSGFDGHSEDGRTLADILTAAHIVEVDVVGLAQSHCVCETALDAAKLGFTVRVFSDLTEPVSPRSGLVASKRLAAARVREVPSG